MTARAAPPAPDESAPAPALFRRFPELAGRIPWLPLGTLPTPVERLRLERFGDAHWIKRDDLTGARCGGNKVRKLEFLLAEAQRRGVRRLITAGAAGSNHALALTVYGRALGFEVSLVLFPQPPTPRTREVLLIDSGLGAELRYAPFMTAVPAAVLAARLAHRAEPTLVVPPGGSDAHGTLGYVSAAIELAEQIASGESPRPEAVHVPLGTMGTAAGLAIGFALADLPVRVSAVRITSRLITNAWLLRRLVSETLRLLEGAGLRTPSVEQVLGRIDVHHAFIGRGYGHETPDARRAAEVFADAGITLDSTYTAKAAVSFLDTLETRPAAPHLFWLTLGSPGPDLSVDAASAASALPPSFRKYLTRH